LIIKALRRYFQPFGFKIILIGTIYGILNKNSITVKTIIKMCTMAVVLMLTSFGLQAQDALEKIGTIIKKGDATLLSAYFDESVELTILDEDDSYSKDQAQAVITQFFEDYSVKSFKLIHEGASNGGLKFGIGEMSTSGSSMRVYICLKEEDGTIIIPELRFEEE